MKRLRTTCWVLPLLLVFGCGGADEAFGLAVPDDRGSALVPNGWFDSPISEFEGLSRPTSFALALDGRVFVAQQDGVVRVVENNQINARPFVTLPVVSGGERGLIGIAIDPSFPAEPWIYLHYTTATPTLHNRVSRFRSFRGEAIEGSEQVLLEIDDLDPAHDNHNGGALHFGPDGRLYIAVGDNAVGANAQSLETLKGKILRINPDGAIPSDNPFYAQTTGRNRAIWAIGLRNPFTFATSTATGRMFINDVGENTWEEVNEGFAGANYGWPQTEGPTTDPRFRAPVYAYPHPQGCAISGGALQGNSFFFADLCGGFIRRLNLTTRTVTDFATNLPQPVDLLADGRGSLYYLSREWGQVRKIARPAPTGDPGLTLVSVSNGKPYVVQFGGGGSTIYIDRTHVAFDVSPSLNWSQIVRPSADDGAIPSTTPHLRLRLRTNASLFVAIDPRGSSPLFLDDPSWRRTSLRFRTEEDGGQLVDRVVYVKAFGAGELTLGGSKGSGAAVPAPYIVLARSHDATPTPVTDLDWTYSRNGWGPPAMDQSNGDIAAGDGRTLQLNGVTYARGLGVHADSEIRYPLNGRYGIFEADLGVDDEITHTGSVVFQVWADDRRVHQSPVLLPNSPTQRIWVSVAGANELRLVVLRAGDMGWDHADWGDARLRALSGL